MSSKNLSKLSNQDYPSTPGERIRYFAEVEKQWKIEELAFKMHIKPPSLYPYLNDKSKPGAEILLKLNALGCDINWVLTGTRIIYNEKGFNELVGRFAALHSEEDYKNLLNENILLKKENAELKKEREKVLKMFNK